MLALSRAKHRIYFMPGQGSLQSVNLLQKQMHSSATILCCAVYSQHKSTSDQRQQDQQQEEARLSVAQVNTEGLCQQRSLKYFQGLAHGCWLVSWAWVEASATAGRWLPEDDYEVKGDHFALGAPKAGAHVQHKHGSCNLYS